MVAAKRMMTRRLFVLGMLLLLVPVAAVAAQDAEKFDPQAAALLDQYVKATGGEAAYDTIRNRVIQGEFSMPSRGVSGTMTSCIAAPNLFYSEIVTPAGRQRRGSNGRTVWMIEPAHGPRIITGLERVLMIRDATLDRFGHWRQLAEKVEYGGQETINGKACATITLTYKALDPQAKEAPVTIYVDTATSLIVQYTTEISRPNILAKITAALDDYQRVDGILLPHKLTLKSDELLYTVTLTSVQNNIPLPSNQFVLPLEIQKLLVQGK